MPKSKRRWTVSTKKQGGAFSQLKRALRLQNNHNNFVIIIKQIREICEMYLNVLKTPIEQKEALERVNKKVIKLYPDLFDGEGGSKSRKCLMKYIQNFHNATRNRMRLCRPRNRESTKLKIRKKPASSQVPHLRGEIKLHTRTPTTKAYVLITTPAKTEKPVVSSPPQDYLTPTIRLPLVELAASASHSTQISPTTVVSKANWEWQSFHSSTAQNASSSNMSRTSMAISQPNVTQGHQIGSIHEFLDSCIPSMSGLLQRFIDFGCDTEEHLLAISLWTDDEIEDLLKKKLPPGPKGMNISDMDVLCLRRHFKTYF